MSDLTRLTAAEIAGARRRRRDLRGRGHPGPPGPDRRRRRPGARLPARRHRGRARRRPRRRRAPRRRRDARPAGRGAGGGQGRAHHQGRADHRRLEDPRGLASAVRLDDRAAAARRRHGDARQDEHGRVRDGLLHRVLGVRADPQPVGPGPDPGRLRRWQRRRAGRVRGAAGDRLGHRRLDPPARRGHRHRRRQAHLRRHLPLRPGRLLLLAGHPRPVRPYGARRRAAARGDRRARPARLHLDPGAGAGRGGRRPPRRHR